MNNVADVVSRGHHDIKKYEEIWLNGPNFLKQFHSDWQVKEVSASLEDVRELKRSSAFGTFVDNIRRSPMRPPLIDSISIIRVGHP